MFNMSIASVLVNDTECFCRLTLLDFAIYVLSRALIASLHKTLDERLSVEMW